MSNREQENNQKKNKLLTGYFFVGYILASCIWIFCLLVLIYGFGKGGIGYILAVVFFIAWPVFFIFLILFLRIFLPLKKK